MKTIYKYYAKKSMTDYEKIVGMNQWLAANVDYDARYYSGIENIPAVSYTAKGALEKGVAVCDGYTKAFTQIMKHYGIPCKRVVGGDHAWNLVKVGSKWHHVDTTWNDPDGKSESGDVARTTYLLVPDSVMEKDHKWNKKSYPKASSKKINKNVTHTGIHGATLNRNSAMVEKGKTVTFKVTGTKKKVTFKSSNTKVATVSGKGKVKGRRAGTANIKIKIGDKGYTCKVTVTK